MNAVDNSLFNTSSDDDDDDDVIEGTIGDVIDVIDVKPLRRRIHDEVFFTTFL